MASETKITIRELLKTIIKEEAAQKGSVQKYDVARNELLLVATEGFSENFIHHFKIVKPFDSSSCGRAFGVGTAIVINDVELDRSFLPHLNIARSEGFRAVKSMPIVDADGGTIGVVSVHFSEPKLVVADKLSVSLSSELAFALKSC